MHQQFSRRLFEHAGWNDADFIGDRCDVASPIWGAAYYLSFDFSGSRAPE